MVKWIGGIDCYWNLTELYSPEPFMASLRNSTGNHICAGTLIHPWVVLTAAQCVGNDIKPDVHIGRCEREGSDEDSGFEAYATDRVIPIERWVMINCSDSLRVKTEAKTWSCSSCVCSGHLPVGCSNCDGLVPDILCDSFQFWRSWYCSSHSQ